MADRRSDIASIPGVAASMVATTRPISRKPLFCLNDLFSGASAHPACAAMQSAGTPVSSGRAAIFQALGLLGVRRGDRVLVPTYHCPTLVAPVVALGAEPVFYPLIEPGLPDLGKIPLGVSERTRAIIVPQLFGLPLDLSLTRAWCDRHGIPMVEDCAHSLFGHAGELLAGQWGDFATASLTKFLPVGELGWLYSSRRAVVQTDLHRCSLRSEIKGLLDPLQIAAEHGRLGALGTGVRALSRWRSAGRAVDAANEGGDEAARMTVAQAMLACDLGRVSSAPALASRLIAWLSDLPAVAESRRRNFRKIAELFHAAGVGHPLWELPPDDGGPYVLPVLVDDPGTLYPAMRRIGFPVYRWDRLWPGTPEIPGDITGEWRYRLLQVPVHQSYTDAEFERLGVMLEQLAIVSGNAQA